MGFTKPAFVELTPFLFGIRLKPHPHAAAWSKGSGDGYGSLFRLTSAKLTPTKFNFDQEFARPVPILARPRDRGRPDRRIRAVVRLSLTPPLRLTAVSDSPCNRQRRHLRTS